MDERTMTAVVLVALYTVFFATLKRPPPFRY